MAYQLDKGEFRVKCDIPKCPFNAECDITQKIAGVIKRDVENEAKRIARDMASIKHDAMYGRLHRLTKPGVRMVSGTIKQFGAGARKTSTTAQEEGSVLRDYRKRETVVKKGKVSTTICEVIKGHVYPEKDPSFKYQKGDIFGASDPLIQQNHRNNLNSRLQREQVKSKSYRERLKTLEKELVETKKSRKK